MKIQTFNHAGTMSLSFRAQSAGDTVSVGYAG